MRRWPSSPASLCATRLQGMFSFYLKKIKFEMITDKHSPSHKERRTAEVVPAGAINPKEGEHKLLNARHKELIHVI